MKEIIVYIVSDSVGETGENVAKAVISQFRPNFEKVKISRFAHIKNVAHLEKIVTLAKTNNALVVYTLVEIEMRKQMQELCIENNVSFTDLLGPLMNLIGGAIDEQPLGQPGLVHQLDDFYFKKIEAIEFAVKYDDGRDPRGILLADIVLIGVSRTSKTPLSQYLANKRLKVANVPLVPEVEPPKELYEVDPNKCFGLVISPDQLNSIRKERLIALGLTQDAIYAQHTRIEQEIEHFYNIANKVGCEVIDVTNRAVEETANKIIELIRKRK